MESHLEEHFVPLLEKCYRNKVEGIIIIDLPLSNSKRLSTEILLIITFVILFLQIYI